MDGGLRRDSLPGLRQAFVGPGPRQRRHRERELRDIGIVRMPLAGVVRPHVVLHRMEPGGIVATVRLQRHLHRLQFRRLPVHRHHHGQVDALVGDDRQAVGVEDVTHEELVHLAQVVILIRPQVLGTDVQEAVRGPEFTFEVFLVHLEGHSLSALPTVDPVEEIIVEGGNIQVEAHQAVGHPPRTQPLLVGRGGVFLLEGEGGFGIVAGHLSGIVEFDQEGRPGAAAEPVEQDVRRLGVEHLVGVLPEVLAVVLGIGQQALRLVGEESGRIVVVIVLEVVRTDDPDDEIAGAVISVLEAFHPLDLAEVVQIIFPADILEGPLRMLPQDELFLVVSTAATVSAIPAAVVRIRTVAVGLMLDASGERQSGYRRQGEGFDHVFHHFWSFPL